MYIYDHFIWLYYRNRHYYSFFVIIIAQFKIFVPIKTIYG